MDAPAIRILKFLDEIAVPTSHSRAPLSAAQFTQIANEVNSDALREVALRAPLTDRYFAIALEKWTKLREGELSFDGLRRFESSQMAERAKRMLDT